MFGMGRWDKVFITSKMCLPTPTWRLVFQDVIAILREEHNCSYTTGGQVLLLLRGVDMRDKGCNFVVNLTRVKFTHSSWLVTSP